MHWLIILLSISLGSCDSPPKSWNWGMKARPISGFKNFPSADTDYGYGFKNGCEGSILATSRGLTDFLDASIDPVLAVKNADYSRGWWDGHEQCTYISDWNVL